VFKHFVASLDLKVDGDQARSTSYWMLVATQDGKRWISDSGTYLDVLRREQGRWKFQSRTVSP
jgi:hypothetical protein